MKLQKYVAVASLVSAALATSAGVAHAAPAAPPAPVISTPFGSITIANDQIQASAPNGDVVASTPAAPLAGFVASVAPALPAPAAQLAQPEPVVQEAARPVPVTPVLDYGWKTEGEREQWAFKRAQDSVSFAATGAAATGAAAGAGIGCVAGGILGAAVTTPVAWLLGVGPLAGCVAGAAVGIPLGGAITAAAVTIPIGIAAAIGYFDTVNQPFVPPKSSPQKVQIVP